MYRGVALWALLLLLLLAGGGGYLLGVNRQNDELNDLRAEVTRLREQLELAQGQNRSTLRAIVDDLLWAAWRAVPLAGVGVCLWAVYVLVDKRRRIHYPNQRGQLPAVEKKVAAGETALVILDQQASGGVIWGADGVRTMEQPLDEQHLLELAAMVNAVRAAAAATPRGAQPKTKPVDPVALLRAMVGRQRQALPEVQVIQDAEIIEVLSQLEGPNVGLLAERLEE